MEYSTLRDKCRGSLVGGAVGDALGYEVEFMSLSSIRKRFGKRGITRYVLHNDIAQFSDDTQMTLFTLEGLMNGIKATNAGNPETIIPFIVKAYLNWYLTQTTTPSTLPDSQLANIPSLWSRRAPGLTCLGSLEKIYKGNSPTNHSKGCGGVMRVAPIGIFNAAHSNIYKDSDTARLAGWAAEITHKHIASTFASALLATTVEKCIQEEEVDRIQFKSIISDGLILLDKCFPGHEVELKKITSLIRRAMELGESEMPQEKAIRELGEGWVGDEAVAIAIFSVMRHIGNFEECIICAVNHDGDSDSTGAIAGNIIGGILGYSAIPQYFIDNLEIEPILVKAADGLCGFGES